MKFLSRVSRVMKLYASYFIKKMILIRSGKMTF